MAGDFFQPTVGGVMFRADPNSSFLDLVSATPDGPLGLILEFNQPPIGDESLPASYQITTLGSGVVPVITLAERWTDPGHELSHLIRLTFAGQATIGEIYTVAVVGNLTGAGGAELDNRTASWTAVGTGPAVESAASVGLAAVRVVFDESVIGCDTPGDWLVAEVAGDPVTVDSVDGTGAYRTLTLAAALVPGQTYTVTAPAATTNISSNVIAEADREAEFVVPVLTGRVSIRATGGTAKCLVLLVMPPVQASEEV